MKNRRYEMVKSQ